MSDGIPRNGEIQIGGVFPAIRPNGLQKRPKRMPAAVEHRPHEADLRIRWGRSSPTHALQSLSARSPEQSHQEQFDPVVPVVPKADGMHAKASRGVRQEPMPKPPRAHLQALATPLTRARDLKPLHDQPDPQAIAQSLDKCLVSIGFLTAQSVVRVGDEVRGLESPRLPGQSVQEGNRIRPA